jgi:D-glycero-D-manno-heptose 1,7-bisphosphate phosphatase
MISDLKRYPIICLDRDGVINQDSDAYVKNADEWIPLPGSLEAIATLTKAGKAVMIASNQAGISKGKFTAHDLENMTLKMLDLVNRAGGKIQKIFYCTHAPTEGCRCRKPMPGMLLDAAAEAGVSPQDLIFVGDRETDIEAAIACGALPILLLSGKGQKELDRNPDLADKVEEYGGRVYQDLNAFVEAFLEAFV